ncbi:ATP-grasp domain-containing protein [Bacillus sp. NSP9.1]|nr:ATP-grasp domain-containing protein [Bacillus sp. NSP9.1]
MSTLILNKTAYGKSPYDVWLEELDGPVVMLTSADRVNECRNYDVIEAFDDYPVNGCIEMRALELNETYHFKTIIASSEFDMLRAGKLRSLLGIKGQSYESARLFRNKVLMKEHVKKAGVRVPDFKKIDSAADLSMFVQTFGFPVIVKPVYGSGSVDTTVLRNRQDMWDFLAKGLPDHLEVEVFIEGDMYHIDGLILGGETILSWPSRYINGCLAFQEQQFLGSLQLERKNPLTRRLIDFVQKVLDALPVPETTTFHAEVFHTPDDELVFCEVASRTGGAMVREATAQTFGFDINEVCVKAQCGLDFHIPEMNNGPRHLSGWLLIPPKDGVLKEIKAAPSAGWLAKQHISAQPGDRFHGSSSSVDAIASCLVTGRTEAELSGSIDRLAMWFQDHTVWGKASDVYTI